MERVTPLGACLRGFTAGIVGSAIQNVFFKLTAGRAPAQPPGPYPDAPELQQHAEIAVETLARRVVEQLAHRGPLTPASKVAAGQVVHYAFGSSWGSMYGLTRGTFPALRGPVGALAFAVGVWAASDGVLLPALRLAPWPRAHPARTHAYAIASHLVYGAGTWLAYEALRPKNLVAAVAAVKRLRGVRNQGLAAVVGRPGRTSDLARAAKQARATEVSATRPAVW